MERGSRSHSGAAVRDVKLCILSNNTIEHLIGYLHGQLKATRDGSTL